MYYRGEYTPFHLFIAPIELECISWVELLRHEGPRRCGILGYFPD